jgi:two-component system OmpR family sensor kinase
MSLRARVAWGIALIAVVLVGAAFVVTRTTRSYLLDQVDGQLADAVPSARRLHPGPGGAVPTPSISDLFVGFVNDGQLVTYVRPSLQPQEVSAPAVDASTLQTAATEHPGQAFTVPGTNGPSYRVIALQEPDGDILVLGLPLGSVNAAMNRLVLVEVAVTLFVLAVLAVVAFWVLRLGVRPVKEMTASATAIAEGDLSHRVPVAPAGTEAGQLGAALNTMLGRIEAAFDARAASEQRLRRFVADASHELRTPLTTIRGYAELYRQGGLEDREALDQAMRRTEQEALRMGGLVDDLLLLARLDQGRPLEKAPLDLGVLAIDSCSDAQVVAPDHRIVADVQPDVIVDGDEPRLRQVVHNLVRNAVVHTPTGTNVHVQVAVIAGRAVLEVRDDGPGMDSDAVAHAFERFWRADTSRARVSGGSGLGLSIVQAIVEAHGGHVSLSSTQGVGTTVRVDLPLAYARSAASPPLPAPVG